MNHDYEKLPKWVQDLFTQKDIQLEILQQENARLKLASEVLQSKHWLQLDGPKDDWFSYWQCEYNQPKLAFNLYPGDVLLIGRGM